MATAEENSTAKWLHRNLTLVLMTGVIALGGYTAQGMHNQAMERIENQNKDYLAIKAVIDSQQSRIIMLEVQGSYLKQLLEEVRNDVKDIKKRLP